jgi:hypothetical protein
VFAASLKEAGQTGAERAGALDSESASSRRVLLGESQRFDVPAAVRVYVRLEHNCSTANLDDAERVRVAMRINADDKVQLICKHF